MRLLLGALLAARPEAVELEDLRVGEVNDLVEELTSGGAEAPLHSTVTVCDS